MTCTFSLGYHNYKVISTLLLRFTSDALGHPSLIPPMSYSARLPEISGSVYDSSTKRYVIARCRLVQLAQRVKHRLSHPDCCCGYTFDQASALEDEIRRWSRESISQDEDEKADERRHGWELSLAAQVLVLRVYAPFLISASSAAAAKNQTSGASGPGKTPGKPGLGEKPQIQGSAMAMATQSCLGAAQAILRLGNKLNVSVFKEPGSPNPFFGPVLMDLYPLERLVLDAVVITQSSTAVSVVSEAEVRRGMEIMMEREFTLGKERREVWEQMKQRILVPSRLQISQGSQPVMKRKHDQLSPVVGNGNDVTQKKHEGLPLKHAKTSAGPLPVLGVRFRQGRMGPSGPIQPVDSNYDREARSYTSPHPHPHPAPSGQMNAPQLQHHPIPPHETPSQIGPYDASPSGFSPEQPSDMQMGHRNSFDQTQSKQIYNFEEAPMSSAYTDYANNGASTHSTSSSSSPHPTSTSSYNPPQFGSPDNSSNRTPSSQMTSESPNLGYASSDGQAPRSGPPKFGPDARSPFENPRPTLMTENPQPQVFDKMLPPSTFSHSGDQSPAVGATPSIESATHDSGPPQFAPQHSASHAPQGYFHPGNAIGSYDAGGMLPLGGVRMEESVPSTPIYEKPHMVYDNKAPQHQMLQHGGHALAVNSHSQHSMVGDGFVGDQSQSLAMSGTQPPHHSWTPSQPPQPLVTVPAGQSYW
ncbi:hypothetical protein AN958_05306 [Leucoagaricus sp. SymC.cos]|nr:hypothetical protein AN958_05306 [Leucoagaricus sp. SymC.cos]